MKRIKHLCHDHFDLRYRLQAVGARKHFEDRPEEFERMVNALKTAIDAGKSPRECNRIVAQYRGPPMCFSNPRPNHTLVYQVRIQLDGTVVCNLPVENGMTLAHRRLGDKLLRVRFAPLPKGASDDEKRMREELKKDTIASCGGPLLVGKRHHLTEH